MSDYVLQLELYVEADSPEDAVREGEAMVSDPARGPFVWSVKRPSDPAWQDIDAEDVL